MKTIVSMILLTVSTMSWAGQSPYAGDERRPIKSLSTHEVDSLRRGDGMGFAKLAELNHFPGPRHVLELGDELELSEKQLVATGSLFEEMRRQAIALGEALLSAEARLDRQFESASVTPQSLEAALLEIGELRARLRYVHLEAHLRQKALLESKQIRKYDSLRGYGNEEHDHRRRTH